MEGHTSDFAHIRTERNVSAVEFLKREPTCVQRVIGSHGFSRPPVTSHCNEYKVLEQYAGVIMVERINCSEHLTRLTMHPCGSAVGLPLLG